MPVDPFKTVTFYGLMRFLCDELGTAVVKAMLEFIEAENQKLTQMKRDLR